LLIAGDGDDTAVLFQPFLRFWRIKMMFPVKKVGTYVYVSTLLEILEEGI
jgi:hypothetical protein